VSLAFPALFRQAGELGCCPWRAWPIWQAFGT
jgi:hypothetical protein